ncbi:MAG: M15 family metallopeptidase [Roseiflexus sp.]
MHHRATIVCGAARRATMWVYGAPAEDLKRAGFEQSVKDRLRMSERLSIRWRAAAPSASESRRGAAVTVIVFHNDPSPAEQAIARWSARAGTRSPHYHIAADGTITQLVDEARAARHSGLAKLGRVRNIDRISIGVAIESAPRAAQSREQVIALRRLTLDIQHRYGLLADAALLHWTPPRPGVACGTLTPFTLPPMPEAPPVMLLGSQALDNTPERQQALWLFLQNETAARAGGFNIGAAFHLHAARNNLGAPMAPSSPRSAWLTVNGRQYNYQHFARDTVFNEGEKWAEVQTLGDLIAGCFPAAGTLAFDLLKSSFNTGIAGSRTKNGNTQFNPGWAFHRAAAEQRLGPALSGSYRITVDGQQYSMQVFCGDVLYTPVASPETKTNWNDVRKLSETPPGPLSDLLWAETYKASGAAFDPASPFHQAAVASRIGAPLTDVYQKHFQGIALTIQVFAFDTLYQVDNGPVRCQSQLTLPPQVAQWKPKIATPPPVVKPPVAHQVATPGSSFPMPPGDRTSPQWPPLPDFKPLVTAAQRQALFGVYEFVPDPSRDRDGIRILGTWEQDNIVTVQIPQLIGRNIRGAPANGAIRWHRLAVNQLLRLWKAWEEAGLLDRLIIWNGSYSPRFIRGRKDDTADSLSNHAFGTAFDINHDPATNLNGLNAVPALVGQPGSVRELAAIARHFGFYWGGHFPRPDGMHFEVAVLQP